MARKKSKAMVLETPVLTCRSHAYYVGNQRWMCSKQVLHCFVSSPERISLSLSSKAVRGAVRWELRKDLWWPNWRVCGRRLWDVMGKGFDSTLFKFLNAGHKKMWVTCYEHYDVWV